MQKNENSSEKVSAPETRKHTMDCLSKGDASACPICKPINDAAFQRDRDELHKEQDQLLESEVNANQNRAKIRMSRYAVTHVRPDGTKIMLDVVQSTSLARAKRTFTKLHPIQAKNFRPFTVQEVA